jgi:hypothetical protein
MNGECDFSSFVLSLYSSMLARKQTALRNFRASNQIDGQLLTVVNTFHIKANLIASALTAKFSHKTFIAPLNSNIKIKMINITL